MRVGASAGVGARLLAREDAHAVGMIGSGGMARTVLEALVEVRDIKHGEGLQPRRRQPRGVRQRR